MYKKENKINLNCWSDEAQQLQDEMENDLKQACLNSCKPSDIELSDSQYIEMIAEAYL